VCVSLCVSVVCECIMCERECVSMCVSVNVMCEGELVCEGECECCVCVV
jgi:hypothetical protein